MSSLVAAASSSGGSGNLLIFALPLALIAWMFYAQRRRTKESQRLQSTLGVGDEVTTPRACTAGSPQLRTRSRP